MKCHIRLKKQALSDLIRKHEFLPAFTDQLHYAGQNKNILLTADFQAQDNVYDVSYSAILDNHAHSDAHLRDFMNELPTFIKE
jgi:hypothetical protein